MNARYGQVNVEKYSAADLSIGRHMPVSYSALCICAPVLKPLLIAALMAELARCTVYFNLAEKLLLRRRASFNANIRSEASEGKLSFEGGEGK